FQTALQYTPVARISAPVVIQESQAVSAPGGEVVFSSPPQRLPAGTYRVQIIRVDPKDENAMAMPAANP
ncbi:MAG TPA: hypothetical protein VFT74_09045, partial [Isosphaeraceae bacterium]|nr:hypothetical protein [Isosphaeraceae bacterium]